jgi:Ni,Fe-hydrogenase III small subunit
MLYVLKRLWKYGLGTLPRRQLNEMQTASAPYMPDYSRLPQNSQRGYEEELEMIQERLTERIKKIFGRSLHIRHLDSGSSNACEWEVTALLNPVYDVQRFGIDFVASPRHADMLLVTGGVTRNLEEAVRKTYAATPAPKLVVAVGDDACGTGFAGRTYAHYGGVDQIIPVHVYVPGDPPTPVSILQGILKALEQTH